MTNAAIIIFGASGDLAKRKLIPALYALIAQKKLNNFVIIGASIDDITVDHMLDQARDFMPEIDTTVWQKLRDRSFYQQLDFKNREDYTRLHTLVAQKELQFNVGGNRLVYIAAASLFYCEITQYLAESHLVEHYKSTDKTWNRIVYEKPFGHDLASARAINSCITAAFYEEQIYRIDHYLSKELVSNIALMRFTNTLFEPLWNNVYIDQVYINLSETIGIEGRGRYYDTYGALCDVVQNHMLELLALTAMDAPHRLEGDFIRSKRVKVLESIRVDDGILGQYAGYQDEPDVAPHSRTDTFALLKLSIDNDRWRGVPFFLKTGKRLDKKETAIRISFKPVDCLLAHNCPTETNSFTISIDPDGYFKIDINAKKPGTFDELTQIPIEFSHRNYFGRETAQAYELLLQEIMRGEQSASVRQDEIEYAWRIIDRIHARKFPMYEYQPGSRGPYEIEEFKKKQNMRWIE